MQKIHVRNKISLVNKNVLINKHEGVGSKHCNKPKAFIEYSNDMDDI